MFMNDHFINTRMVKQDEKPETFYGDETRVLQGFERMLHGDKK